MNSTGLQEVTLELLEQQIQTLSKNVDYFFIIIMGIAITFMIAGFAYLEAGSIHQKNATNVMFRRYFDYVISGVAWWLFGYTLAFGEGNNFLGIYYYQGGRYLFAKQQYSEFFFQISFASIAATILSGSIVGRIAFWAYFIYSWIVSGVLYPIVVHWVWYNDGWLFNLGFKDFAGGGVVHLMGGSCALMGAIILGPRIGKFNKDEEMSTIEKGLFEHHSTLTAGLGALLVIPGVIAYNAGSALHIAGPGQGELVGKVAINTWLGCSGSSLGALVLFKLGLGDGSPRWSFLNSINAGVAGYVSICAHVDAFDLWAAFVTGLCASLVYVMLKKLVHKLKIDDPLDVVAIHFGGGLWGVTIPSILRQDSLVGGFLDYSGFLLAYQIAGALSIITWSMSTCFVLFGVMRVAGILRSTPQAEMQGADIGEHGEPAYIGIPCDHNQNINKTASNVLTKMMIEENYSIPRVSRSFDHGKVPFDRSLFDLTRSTETCAGPLQKRSLPYAESIHYNTRSDPVNLRI